MTQNLAWGDWIDESPFQLRFRSKWLNYDGTEGPGTKVDFCGLKKIDFAVLAPDDLAEGLYLVEVKSSEWLANGDGNLEDKICNLFRCYLDSLSILARSKDTGIKEFRQAASSERIKLVLFIAPRLPGKDSLMGIMDSLRRKLAKKLKYLDIEPEVMIETLDTVKRKEHLLFDARRKT
ncbi:MAG: hypothetical protein IBX50_20085 [Marinospirillum sp.]|uniref:hypothetical protein n=1 Tax=Marinospirillum sp. TaxID=2183934 RepID=UPI001A0278AF|nr:hypothetical protein [Marinospirillum sp.]MBE0508985.1 hypothetical protein [Marinospirillum sp.]